MVSTVEQKQKDQIDPWSTQRNKGEFLDAIQNPAAEVVARYWFDCAETHGRPSLACVEPKALGTAAEHIFVLDCADPEAMRVRVFGRGAKRLLGDIRENDDLVEIMQQRGTARSLCLVNEVTEEGCVIHETHERQSGDGHRFVIERLLFPLFGDDGQVREVLGVVTGGEARQDSFTKSTEIGAHIVSFEPDWPMR